jgi:hypothetical protein
MPEKEAEIWTIDELVALTKEVQNGEIEYRGKKFLFQYCELTEAEEPKITMIDENASADEKNEFYTKVGTERILSMIKKANDKNPEGVTLTDELWKTLPATLRFSISAEILSIKEVNAENFING